MSKKLFLIALMWGMNSYANLNYHVDARYRSVPSGYNLTLTAAYDGLIHGQYDKSRPFYGYYKIGAKLGGSPTGAVFVQVAPIAPLIFEAQKGATYRFIESTNFNCEKVYCYGVIDRTDLSARLLAGYKNFIFSASYLYREIRTPSSSGSVMLDLEYFTVSPGNHKLIETGLVGGYKMSEDTAVAITYSKNEISDGQRQSSSYYALYRFRYWDLDWAAGAGRMHSAQPNIGGNAVLIVIGKKWGENLSLL